MKRKSCLTEITLAFSLAFLTFACTPSEPDYVPPTDGEVKFSALTPGASSTNDWPQFRGPNRNGVSQETGLIRSWPESGPKTLWRKSIGVGYSGIAIESNRIYTSYADGSNEVAFCFDADSGDEIWRHILNKKYNEQYGDGPRSTPTIDGDFVYVLGSYGPLYALNKTTGEQIWTVNIHDAFGDKDGDLDRGYSCSPLIEGDMLIVNGGRQPKATIVALNKRTGETIWTYQNGRNSYSSQSAWDIGGTRQIVSPIGYGLVGLSAADGKELWKFPWDTSYDLNIAVPSFFPPNFVMLSSGYDKGAALLQITKSGDSWQVDRVWSNRHFRNHFNASVTQDGYVYGFDNNLLKCLDAKSGEAKWKARGYNKGSLLLADGMLVILGEKGKLALVEVTPEAYNELAAAQVLSGKCWTAPSLSNGRLYARSQSELVSIDLMNP